MQPILSLLVVISMLGQTIAGFLPMATHHQPALIPRAGQLAVPNIQDEEDLCLVIANATYLPIILRSNEASNNSSSTTAESVNSSANTSALKGRVLDANEAAQGVEKPLTGVTVCSLETGTGVKTDANGEFLLSGLPSNESHVQYIGDTALPLNSYASYRAKITLVDDTITEIARPIYLMKKDPGGQVQIDPNQTTTLINSNLGIELTIPPHTVKGDDGEDFTGVMSVSEVPASFTPGSLPDTLGPGLVATIQPMGLTFAQPVPVTFPNNDNLTPGSEVDLWSMDHDTGTFFIAGTGRVSNDGTVIETISGGVREASWHFSLPPWSEGSKTDDGDHPNNEPGMCSISSQVAPHSGNLETDIWLPAYVSMGDTHLLNFVYSTERAYPFQLFPVETTIQRRAAVPSKISIGLTINGTANEPAFINTSGLNGSIDETVRASIPVDLSNYDTGVYPATVRLTSHYNTSNVATALGEQMVVVNEQNSPFGAGWGLAGLSKLIENADGSLLVIDGDGTDKLFSESALDLSTWTQEGKLEDGNWIVASDGTSVLQTINTYFDPPGAPTFFVSPENHLNTTLRGKLKVETTADDDYIGFMFGYQSPVTANGDAVNDFEFLLFDWRKSSQTGLGFTSLEGFSLVRVNGNIDDFVPGFFGHVNSSEFEILVTDFGSDKGWVSNTEYDFELLYKSDRIKISINNETIFDVLGSFPEGRFGFYNFSQAQVRYSDFTSSKVTTLFQGPSGDYSTLTKNSDDTYTHNLKGGTAVHFNSTGLQTSMVDRNGNTTAYGYDDQQRLTSITDATGLMTTLAYSGDLLNSVTYPDGRITTFAHTGSDLTSVTFPDSTSQSFGYDSHHLMTSETDRRGFVRTRQFDQYGRIIQANLPDGSTRTTSASQKIGLIDPATGVGTEANPAPVVRPSAALSELIDGEGRIRTFSTGPVNRFASVTDPSGLTTSYNRDEDGNATRITQPSGAIYDQNYDTQGNLTSFTDQTLNGTTSFAYNSSYNQVASITDPFNNVTNFSYDGSGNLTQITTPLNRTAAFEYDNSGLVTRSVDPLGTEATFSYNSSGNLTQISQGTGLAQRVASLSYTPQGYVDTMTDPLGRNFSTSYDLLGRSTSESLPGGRSLSYGYDSEGSLISLTPPGKPAHTFGYDEMGLVSAYTAPPVSGGGTNQTLYAYNNAQELTQVTRPDGQTLAFAYDSAGRLDSLTIPRGQLAYGYSATTGQVTSLTAPDGVTLDYSYNDDILTGVSWSGPVNGTVNYSYDKATRLTQTTVNGSNIIYSYDTDGMVTQAGQLSLSYDASTGLINSTTLTNVSDSWSFNQFAELSNYSVTANSSPLFDMQYNRDDLGRIITKTEIFSSVTTVYDYSYDAAGRLATVRTNGAITEQYTYDLNGNRLIALGVDSTTYDSQDRLLQYGPATYSYTANGELLTKTSGGQTTSYDYDVLGNLMGVTLPNGDQIDYLIDGQNRRIGKKLNGSLVQGLLYQDDLNPVAELDGAGNVVSFFVYASQGNVPDYIFKNNIRYRLITDHLGSVRLVVNSNTGEIVQRLDYDAFGRVLTNTNPTFQPFGFAGGLYDPDTGLVRFGARDYDAEVGRWTTKDPIGFEGGDANLYAYVGSDPINFVDPNGKKIPWREIIIAIGLLIGNPGTPNDPNVPFEKPTRPIERPADKQGPMQCKPQPPRTSPPPKPSIPPPIASPKLPLWVRTGGIIGAVISVLWPSPAY